MSEGRADKRLSRLQEKLYEMGYHQPLVLEAVPIVERLVHDLIHCTTSSKAKIEGDVGSRGFELSVESYKNENGRLLKEISDLRLKTMKQKEDLDDRISDLTSTVKKMEKENIELKLINSQFALKVKSLEKESKAKNERILELQERNVGASVETSGPKQKTVKFRKQRMEVEDLMYPSNAVPASSNEPLQYPVHVPDLLQSADRRVAELKESLSILLADKEKLVAENSRLRSKLTSRDEEMGRLHQLLETGRSAEDVVKSVSQQNSQKVIAHLNTQVDFLHQINSEMEQRLKESTEKLASLELKNRELVQQQPLASVQSSQQNVRKAVRGVLGRPRSPSQSESKSELYRRMAFLEGEVKLKHQALQDAVTESHQLKKERDSLLCEVSDVKKKLCCVEEEKGSMLELLTKLDKEKVRCQEKLAKAFTREFELAMDLERMGTGKTTKSASKDLDYLVSLIRSLEEERDHLLQESRSFLATLKKKLVPSPFSMDTSQSGTKTAAHFDAMLQMMKDERDYFKQEFELLKSRFPPGGLATTDDHRTPDPHTAAELDTVRRERDGLQNVLQNLESQFITVHQHVKELTQDHENLKSLYEQSTQEVRRLRMSTLQSHSDSPHQSASVQAIIRRTEQERDAALQENRLLYSKLTSVEQQLELARESLLKEKQRNNHRRPHVETLLQQADKENIQSNQRVRDLRDYCSSLEQQLKITEGQLVNLRDERLKRETELSSLRLDLQNCREEAQCERLRCSQLQNELADERSAHLVLKHQFEETTTERGVSEDRYTRMQNLASMYEDRCRSLNEDISKAKEDNRDLQHQVQELRRKDSSMELQLRDLERKTGLSQKTSDQYYQELSVAKARAKELEAQLEQTRASGSNADRAVSVLKSDLDVMNREHQRLREELRTVLEDQNRLKDSLGDASRKLYSTQEQLDFVNKEKAVIESDNTDLRKEVCKLNDAIGRLEDKLMSKQSDLVAVQRELNDLQDRLHNAELQCCSVEEMHMHCQNELSDVTQRLCRTEGLLERSQETQLKTEEELTAVRDLCVRLDGTRNDLQNQLQLLVLERDKLKVELEESLMKLETQGRQVQAERAKSDSVEKSLGSIQLKTFYQEQALTQSQGEMESLRNEISRLKTERNNLSADLSRMANELWMKEEVVQRLRKQLIKDQYDRERRYNVVRAKLLDAQGRTEDSGSYLNSEDSTLSSKTMSESSPESTAGADTAQRSRVAPVKPLEDPLGRSTVESPVQRFVDEYSTDC